ncbi:MAG: TonB-dependent receptor [Bacteroidales bacterium]|nr:TonB-dependent receptor [Bacteroidales bacterium]
MKSLITYLLIGCAALGGYAAGTPLEPESAPSLTDEQIDSIMRVFNLDEIVITGTRTPKALKDTPVTTRLLTEQDLRMADATNIQDMLQQELPGVEFSYAMNQQVNMNLAGFSGQSVLILLDGERLAGETMENVDFSRLNMNGVKRIEIIRGAASALYGSNAAGGVINIISKEADKPFSLDLNARAADHNEWRAGGSLGLKGKRVSNTLDVNFNRMSTYHVCLDTKDECDYRTVYGFRSWNFQDRLIYKPIDALKLTARAGYYFKERLYNPETPDRYRSFSAGLRGEWAITPDDKLELSYSFDQYDKSDYVKEYGLDVKDYSNVQNSVRTLYSHSFAGGDMLTVGADFMRDYLDTYQFGPGETHHQYTADAFAQYDWNINRHWEVIAAGRWDYFSDGGDNYGTTKVSARYRLDALSLRGGYAGGFRAPTLKEKYMMYNMADIFDIHGNPDLKSEKSHNFNISAEYNWKNFYFTLGGNYNFVDDRITTSSIYYTELGEPYVNYINIKSMRVFGIDATVRARWLCGISGQVSYNYTHEESVGGTINQYCPARPHAINTRWSYTHAWHRNYETEFVVSGRFLSRVSYQSMHMYAPFEPYTVTNPAYTLWKVQLSQLIMERVRLTVAVDNIFNYAPGVYSYNAPVTLGANLMIGLSLSI